MGRRPERGGGVVRGVRESGFGIAKLRKIFKPGCFCVPILSAKIVDRMEHLTGLTAIEISVPKNIFL
jgi:hypothetical protein